MVKYARLISMGRPRTFDAQEALAAARAQFWAKGYAATSLDDLMTATGLGKGSLYCAFGDKHQLFLAVLSDYSARSVEGLRQALSEDHSAIEALRGLFRSKAPGPTASATTGVRGCLLVNSTSELAPHDAEVVKLARLAYGAVEDLIAEAVERARDSGDLPPDTHPRELAGLLLAVMQGQEFLAKTGMAPQALRAIGESAASRLLASPKAPGPTRARRRASRAKRSAGSE